MGRKSQRLERRHEIVRAFALVLAEHGYAGATMNAVAQKAGYAPGLLHHHFSDKQEILDELLSFLTGKFRRDVEARLPEYEDPLDAYIDSALKLDQRSDTVAARCWVGILAEAVRNPALFERMRSYLTAELRYLQQSSKGRLQTKDAGALIAFVLGSLVFGAFAPKQASGFAAGSARTLVRALARG